MCLLLPPTAPLRDNELAASLGKRAAGGPAGIASANIGCIAHLQSDTHYPVRHWIEWPDARFMS